MAYTSQGVLSKPPEDRELARTSLVNEAAPLNTGLEGNEVQLCAGGSWYLGTTYEQHWSEQCSW
ncbi:hypothetical protein GcC1_182015, partial [Golovinomyces cichoracearum]